MVYDFSALVSQFFVGLSRSMILFVVTAGLSFVLGVLRVPNIAHGSLYMIGAFSAFSITKLVPGAYGFLARSPDRPSGGRSRQFCGRTGSLLSSLSEGAPDAPLVHLCPQPHPGRSCEADMGRRV